MEEFAGALPGERAYSKAPYHPGEQTNLIAALSISGIQAPWLVNGPVNTETFATYLERILCPKLFPGQIVVPDNYNIHKHAKIQALIEARKCTLLFLPTYSPDLMPIENAFSKLNHHRLEVGGLQSEAGSRRLL